MQKLVIFGTGPIAEVAYYYFREDSTYRVAAFTVDASHQTGDSHLGLSVVPFEAVAERLPPDEFDMFVAMGYGRVNRLRAEKLARRGRRDTGLRITSQAAPRSGRASSRGRTCF